MERSSFRLSKLAIKPWLEAAPKGVVFTNAHVVDPATSALLDGLQTIVIEDGKIRSVKAVNSAAISDNIDLAALPVIDLDGAYICP
jgi:adenine deaminase